MRGRTGSAAAPAARCRNRLRGKFIRAPDASAVCAHKAKVSDRASAPALCVAFRRRLLARLSSIVDVRIKHFANAPAFRKSSGGIVLVGHESARGSKKDEALQRVDHIVAARSESMAGLVLADD